MGFLSSLFKGAASLNLPDYCARQVYEAISETLKWADLWDDHIHVLVTPSDSSGNVTYSNQTGLCVSWWEPNLLDHYRMVIDHYIQDHFKQITNKFGDDEMVFYCSLPRESIGQEAAYVLYFTEKLRNDYPQANITVGSHGRQLSIRLN